MSWETIEPTTAAERNKRRYLQPFSRLDSEDDALDQCVLEFLAERQSPARRHRRSTPNRPRWPS